MRGLKFVRREKQQPVPELHGRMEVISDPTRLAATDKHVVENLSRPPLLALQSRARYVKGMYPITRVYALFGRLVSKGSHRLLELDKTTRYTLSASI
jgi:hypothetical protein